MKHVKNVIGFRKGADSDPTKILVELTMQEAAAIAAILGGLEVEDVEGLVDDFLKNEDADTHNLCQTITKDPSHPFNHAGEFFELIADHFVEQ